MAPTFCWRIINRACFRTDMYEFIFHSLGVWYNFCNDFSSKTTCGSRRVPPVVRGPQFDKHWRTGLHIDPHFLGPRILLYPLSVRRNFTVCPHEPLLKLGVPWVKKSCVTRGPPSRSNEPPGVRRPQVKNRYPIASTVMMVNVENFQTRSGMSLSVLSLVTKALSVT
jgi:hypothetical protein